jgi:alcohol dehydrogenase class IV
MSLVSDKLVMPRTIFFGPGSIANIADVVAERRAKKLFVVTDAGVRRAGLLDDLLAHLAGTDASVGVFDRTEPEPTVGTVDKASKALDGSGDVDLLVSLGGGSVMDVAKCANVVHMNGGSILDYEDGVERPKRIENLLPHIAVPTTAGTGSEATVWAVFIDSKRRFKTAIQDRKLVADVAILDPDMTRTMPPSVAAATGMDALTHAIEAYVSVHANPMTDCLSSRAISLVSGNLRRAVRSRRDEGARANMLLASLMAGAAFSNSSLGIGHTLAEALGGYYRIPHGVTNALMLHRVMSFNLKANPAKYARIYELMGGRSSGLGTRAAAEKSALSVRRLCRDLGLPSRLRDVGVRESDLDGIVDIADRWANSSGNPRRITRRQIRELYESAF